MRRTVKVAGIAALGLAAAVVAAGPVLAYQGDGDCTGTGPTAQSQQQGTGGPAGKGAGNGMGRQSRGPGAGQQAGMGQGQSLAALPMGTLTAAQKADLVGMVDEEKLAHDVYVALAARYPDLVQFSRIANAEAQHQSAVRTLLDRYGIADPTVSLPAGDFASAEFDALYKQLLAQADSPADALAVGVLIEKTDIADLKKAMATVTAPDVKQVYTNLLAGSERHLAAFER